MHPRVTVLQLDTDFPRVAGDVCCPETYLTPPQIIRIAGATVGRIVSDRPDLIDIEPFKDALAQATGDVVVTSCGFLSYWQDHLAALTSKPFISSALTALDWLDHPSPEILTLTFDAASLTPLHFGAHSHHASEVIGLPQDMHLRRVIADNLPDLDVALASSQLAHFIAQSKHPHHKYLLLECTNLPPYKAALSRASGMPVTDILTCIERITPKAVQPHFLT